MSDREEELNAELEDENGALLPDREAMPVITPTTGDDVVPLPPGSEEPGLPPPRD